MSLFKRVFTVAMLGVFVLSVALILPGCGASAEKVDSEQAATEGSSASSSAVEESVPESLAGAAESEAVSNTAENQIKENAIMVEITMKDGGVIKLALDPDAAPITVENFVNLVNDEFYDGLIFHRVIEGFMIQGGDPEGTGMGGSKDNIKGEFASNGWNNTISHVPGVISMARSSDPDSASSQFFITHGDATFLDGDYAAFGTVVEGMDVVNKIAEVETDGNDRPIKEVVIDTIRVIPAE